MKLKPLEQQVVVITGGSSGIGRETALRMARGGAAVVVLSRDEERLATLVEEVREAGGIARSIVCDVTDFDEVRRAVDLVEEWFGRIDTWVNNAGMLLYSEFRRTSPEEFRRIMEVNFMGQIHGALAALPALTRAGGGALVSISSAESFLTLPTHSAYAATKAAVEAAMDGLRRELIDEGSPVSVTTVHPAVIDTPIYRTARTHLPLMPSAPPPVYDACVVADCIVYAATHRVPKLYAGGASRSMSVIQVAMPRLADAVLGRFGMRFMTTDAPALDWEGNLYTPVPDGRVRGVLPRRGRRASVYTWLALRPLACLGLGVAATAAVLTGTAVRRRGR